MDVGKRKKERDKNAGAKPLVHGVLWLPDVRPSFFIGLWGCGPLLTSGMGCLGYALLPPGVPVLPAPLPVDRGGMDRFADLAR
jgi:hypothetical protein